MGIAEWIHNESVYSRVLPSSKVQATCKQENSQNTHTLTLCIFLPSFSPNKQKMLCQTRVWHSILLFLFYKIYLR